MIYLKHLKIFIFIMIIFLNINVFASNTNVSSKIKYSTSSAGGTYNGDEIYLGGYNGLFSVGTRYNGRLSMVSFYISTDDYNFVTNHTYTITLNMSTEDWRNNFMGPQVINAQSNGSLGSILSVSNFRFVSKKQIKFNFKTGSTLYPYIFFRVYSTDYASTNTTAITGVSNWNLSSIYINNNVSSTPTHVPATPTPTPQPNNQDIINNANQNTQDIINNDNQNNQNLIDNANQNTTDIIENNNNNSNQLITTQNSIFLNTFNQARNKKINQCSNFIPFNFYKGKFISWNGTIYDNSDYYYTDFIPFYSSSLTITNASNASIDEYICWYDSNKNMIGSSCNYLRNSSPINSPSGSSYFRISTKDYLGLDIFSGGQCIDPLIENANSNTQSIISEERKNFIREINQARNEEGNFCSNFIPFNYIGGYRISYNGQLISDDTSLYTDFIPINSNETTFSIVQASDTSIDEYICWYDSNKNMIGNQCMYLMNRNEPFPSGSSYFRLSTKNYANLGIFYGNGCTNRLDVINDTMNNSSIDDKTGFFTNFNNDTHGLTGIITLPLATIQSLANSSCVTLSIPVPFTNDSFDLPCMTQVYQSSVPDIYSMWQIVSFGIISYYICLDIFKMVKGFKDPNDDKIEVLDL